MVERETQRETSGAPRRPQSRRRPDVAEAPADPERIRILAYEIYETRRSSGMLGDPVSDWLEAERRLGEPVGTGRAGSEQAGSEQAGSERASSEQAGSDRPSPVRGGSEPASRATTRSNARKKSSGK